MGTGSDRPARSDALAGLADATERLLASIGRLDDVALGEPSLLPGWTRGHVVAHLARNAEGLGRLATWAETGVETPMYGSREERAAAIEADAYRPAPVQLADVASTAARLGDQLAALSTEADDAILQMVSGAQVEGWEISLLRLREVELHHVDLAAGYAVEDWSEGFCLQTLDQLAPGFVAKVGMPFGQLLDGEGRSWTVGQAPATLSGPLPRLLAWLVGRSDGSGLTPAGRDDVPPAPAWA